MMLASDCESSFSLFKVPAAACGDSNKVQNPPFSAKKKNLSNDACIKLREFFFFVQGASGSPTPFHRNIG